MAFAQVEISQKLAFMNRQYGVYRFYFDKNGTLHDEIGAIATIETNTFIYRRQYDLPVKSQTGARKFKREAILIKLLKKSRSKRFMNLYRHSNHPTGQFSRHQLFSATSEPSAFSGYHGASPSHERPHHSPNS